MTEEKEHRYSDLVSRASKSYPPRNPEDDTKELRLYWCDDCEEINLWTYWQGRKHLDAKIMVVGQDWGSPWDKASQATMTEIRKANQNQPYAYLHHNPSLTDANLTRLFAAIGYEDISVPCTDLFFTNLVLGYRNRGLSNGYKKTWAEHDKGYFKELANIIEPKVILCMGRSTFDGVLSAFGVRLASKIRSYNAFIESSDNPIEVSLESGRTAYVFALAHCGAMGTLNRNGKKSTGLEKQLDDWRRIREYL